MSSHGLVDSGEVRTYFTADLTGLERGGQRAAEIAARSAQQINQAMAGNLKSVETSLGNVERAVGHFGGQVTANKAQLAGYSSSILDARGRLVELAKGIEQAKTQFGSNSEQVKKLQADYKALSLDTRGLVVEKQKLQAAMKAAQSSSDGFGLSLSGIGAKLRGVGDQVGLFGQAIGVGIGAGVAKAVTAASDLNESVNKMSVVFGSAGQSVIAFAENSATSLGLSKQAALEAAGGFGNILVSMGLAKDKSAEMSTQLLKLAADMGSLNNVDPSVMLEKLRAGLVGEAEPLRQVGVLLSENTVKLKAAELGYKAVGGQLTEQQKVMARYAIILEQSKTAQGDFSRTSGDFANSLRIVKAQIENAAASLGQQFLPTVKQGLGFVSDLIKGFDALSPSVRQAIGTILGVTAAAAAAVPIISGLAFAFGALLSPIGAVVIAIAALAVAYQQNLGGMKDSVDHFVAATKVAWADHGNTLTKITKALWDTQVSMFTAAMKTLAGIVDAGAAAMEGRWGEMLKKLAQNPLTGGAATFGGQGAADVITGKKFGLGTAVKALDFDQAELRAKVDRWMTDSVTAGIDAAKPKVGAKLKGAGGGMGKALLDGFKDGMEGFGAAVARLSGANLESLFDPVSKKARAGAQEMKSALKVVADGINEFFTAQGIKGAKITVEELAANWAKFQSIIGQVDAFQRVKEAINAVNLDRLASGLGTLDEGFAVVGKNIGAHRDLIEALRQQYPLLITLLEKLGYTFKSITLPELKPIADEADVTKRAVADFASSVAIDLSKAGDALDRLSEQAPKPFDALTLAAMKSAEALRQSLAGSEMLAGIKAQLDIRSSIEDTIRTLEDYGEMLGKSGADLDRWVEDTIRRMPEFAGAHKAALEATIEHHRQAAINLGGVWEDVFGKLDSGTKRTLKGVLDVWNDLPEGISGSLSKAKSQVESWLKFLDSVVRLVQKFAGDTESGLAGIFNSILGFFKKTQSSLQVSTTGISAGIGSVIKSFGGGSAGSGSDTLVGTVTEGSAQAAGALGQLGQQGSAALGGLASATQAAGGIISGVFGALTQAVGVFASTFHDDSRAVRFAGGFLLGGPVGGILSAIFGGPSEFEKQKRALQLDQLRANVQQTAQAVINAAIDGFKNALEFFEKLDDFTAPRRKAFNRFFNQMKAMMDEFVALAGKWSGESLMKAKTLAEAIGPVVQAVGEGLNALGGMSLFVAPAERTIDSFFASLTHAFDKFAELSESVANGIQKRARKFGERLLPVVQVIKEGVDGLTAILNFKEIPAQALDAFGASLRLAVVKIGEIADSVDLKMTKVAARFAERAGVVADLLKSGTEGLAAVATLGAVTPGAFDILFEGISIAVTRLAELGDKLEEEALGKAVAVANAIAPIAAGLKAWVEAAGAAKDYAKVAAETWDNIVADFNHAIVLMDFMLASAIDFLPRSIQFEDVMRQIAEHMKASLSYAGEAVSASAAAFGGVVGAISGGPTGGVFPGGDVGASFAPASFAGSAFAPMAFAGGGGGASSGPVVMEFHFHGPVVGETAIQDALVKGSTQAARRLRKIG